MEITCTDEKMRIRKTSLGGWSEEELRTVDHPGQVLREIIDENQTPELPGIPTFTGGLVGYFFYDYIKYSEPKLRLSDEEKTDFQDMDLMLFDNVIAFDHYRQKIYLITGVRSADLEQSYEKAEAKLNEIEKLLKTGEKMEFPQIQLKTEIKPQFSEEKYEEMVEKAKHYIREGDIFQVVLSNPMRAKAEGSLFDTYRVLRTHNPSPYMFYFPVTTSRLQEIPRRRWSSWKDVKSAYFHWQGRDREEKMPRKISVYTTSVERSTCRSQMTRQLTHLNIYPESKASFRQSRALTQ